MPRHWEGDLIAGKANKSQIATLVERTTRFTMLVPMPGGKQPDAFAEAVTPVIAGLPDALRRSLTWDEGADSRRHTQVAVDADCKIYFCDPHSPWLLAANENTNGLLRQYFPKAATCPPTPRSGCGGGVADSWCRAAPQDTGLEDPRRGTR